jgi:hypothetical protein
MASPEAGILPGRSRWLALASVSLWALAANAHAAPQTLGDPLASKFATPPNSARPRVWWHWMDGNISQDGIAKDLAWMSRIGVGGLQNFDAALKTPQITQRRLSYMSPEWKDAFRFAVKTADHLDLEFGIAGSPGWSQSGGPWVSPPDAMKKLVWSELVLPGGVRFNGPLPAPPSVTGPYQTLPRPPSNDAYGQAEQEPPRWYGDTAVVAYRLAEIAEPAPPRLSTGEDQAIDPALLADPNGPGVAAPRGASSILIEYDAPQTIRSAVAFLPGGTTRVLPIALYAMTLEAQDEAGAWRKVALIESARVPTTVSFEPVTARRFRLTGRPVAPAGARPPPPLPGLAPAAPSPAPPSPRPGVRLTQLQLLAEPRINRFEAKAGFWIVNDYYALDGQVGSDVEGAPPSSVIDLTGRVTADGRLDWTPPPGRWKVLRLGASLVGTTNHPATKEATGLEVDEYDGAAVGRYIDTYLGQYAQITGPDLMGRRGLRAQVNDSTEVGASNWTPAMLDQFQRLRGYDPRPWLPALTGVVIGSRAKSDAFLYDFRRTLADLVASQHYGVIAKAVRHRGMIQYGEALESFRMSLGDDMAMRRHADIPMAALWAYDRASGPDPAFLGDMRGAASVAHVYGQNLVAAESMTSIDRPWRFAPADLKPYVDLEFINGVNRPVIHTSVHQPVDDKIPGLSLMTHGQYFTRHETWAEMARPWVDYMARSAYLLQQGRNHADVAWFYGEEAPIVSLYKTGAPAGTPKRYAFDYANADVVLNQLSVAADGALTTRGGARYRVLYLGGSSQRMTLAVLDKLASLVERGATVVGVAPQASPSLADDPMRFADGVARLWSGAAVTRLGKGRVIASQDVEAALTGLGLGPDFAYQSSAPDAEILFTHRVLADGELYFLSNRKARAEAIQARFRVTGKAPEIWRADTGAISPVSYRVEGGETLVDLDLTADEAVFVLFRKSAKARRVDLAKHDWKPLLQLNQAWTLGFQAKRGAPPSTRLDTLASLTDNADPGIKYFSGVVTYRTAFTLPRGSRPGAPLMLDLGQVGDIAEVRINGRAVGYAWKAPYRLDIGKAIRPGPNQLEVKVANLWINRLIGDAQPGAAKITWTSDPTYLPTATLRPSGLIGPVTLLAPAR